MRSDRPEAEQGGAGLEASEGIGGPGESGDKGLPDKDPGFLRALPASRDQTGLSWQL